MKRRTDYPKAETFRLSQADRDLLTEAETLLSASEGRTVTRLEVLTKAIRAFVRRLKAKV